MVMGSIPIAEGKIGRHQKIYPVKFEDHFTGVHGGEKIFGRNFRGDRRVGYWVEMESCGLIFGGILGSWTY